MTDLPAGGTDEPDPRRLALGYGVAGCAAALLGLVLFFVPFLDLMLTLFGLAISGRGVQLHRATGAPPGETAWMFAVCGLILGVIGLIPGVLITYTAAFRG